MSRQESAKPVTNDQMAEGVGFEPTVSCPTPVFKTGAFDHSATPPGAGERKRSGPLLATEKRDVRTMGGLGRHDGGVVNQCNSLSFSIMVAI